MGLESSWFCGKCFTKSLTLNSLSLSISSLPFMCMCICICVRVRIHICIYACNVPPLSFQGVGYELHFPMANSWVNGYSVYSVPVSLPLAGVLAVCTLERNEVELDYFTKIQDSNNTLHNSHRAVIWQAEIIYQARKSDFYLPSLGHLLALLIESTWFTLLPGHRYREDCRGQCFGGK